MIRFLSYSFFFTILTCSLFSMSGNKDIDSNKNTSTTNTKAINGYYKTTESIDYREVNNQNGISEEDISCEFFAYAVKEQDSWVSVEKEDKK